MTGRSVGRLRAVRRAYCLVPLALSGLLACELRDDLVVRPIAAPAGSSGTLGVGGWMPGGGGGMDAGGAGTNAGGAGQSGTGGSVSVCDPMRTAIPAPPGAGALTRCSAWAARRSFGHALCACEGVTAPEAFTTEAEDSSAASEGSPGNGAAVGINGEYAGSRVFVSIDGSLTLASSVPFGTPSLTVTGDFRARAAVSAIGSIVIDRDAWFLDVVSTNFAGIGRDLYLGPEAELNAVAVVEGDTRNESFDISPPCACGPGEMLDIAGIVADIVRSNDNAIAGVGVDSLAQVQNNTTVTLSCGRYAFRGIAGSGPLTLRIAGRVALAVDGDVILPPDFTLELDPGAELDWFVSGNLALSPLARLGDARRIVATRVYVLGSNEIALPGTPAVAMNLYAPHAQVTASNVYGALFARSVESTALTTRYDRAVLRADEGCETEPPQSCTSCDGCSVGSTCVAGACSACTTDAECCFPLVCADGSCESLTRR